MFNTVKLRELGGFDVRLRFVMDYDIILKLGREGPVKHIKKFCGAFRVHANSKTATIDDVCQRETELLRMRRGVPDNKIIHGFMQMVAKVRVCMRMILQGCIKGRLY